MTQTIKIRRGTEAESQSITLQVSELGFATDTQTLLIGNGVSNLKLASSNLMSGLNSTLHFHNSDRDRANHTGTQLVSTISDIGDSYFNKTESDNRFLQNILDDLSPQLGAGLDVNGNEIFGADAAPSSGSPGASVTIRSGDGDGNSQQGNITIQSGDSGNTSSSTGGILLQGGASTSIASGSSVNLKGGNSSGGYGGSLWLTPGSGSGPSAQGVVGISAPSGATKSVEVQFRGIGNPYYVALKSPDSIAASRSWVLPQDNPATASGKFLTTNSSGVLSFSDIAPTGNNQEIQYNNNGAFGASNNLIFTGSTLRVGTTGVGVSTSGAVGIANANLKLIGGSETITTQRSHIQLHNNSRIDIKAASNVGGDSPGGNVEITAGDGSGTGAGGDIKLTSGTGNTDGTVQVSGDMSVTGNVTSTTPTSSTQLTTKGYVDSLVSGLNWQNSVLDKDLNDPPGSPTMGDRYLISAAPPTATGAWLGHDNEFGEWNGSSWDFTAVSEGMACWVEDEDIVYAYNGTDWVKFGTTTTHNNQQGLNDGDYKHLTAAEKTKLDGIEAGATGDLSASEILTEIKTVDGTGSGLDADLLDGKQGSDYDLIAQIVTANTTLTAKKRYLCDGGIDVTLPASPTAGDIVELLPGEDWSTNALDVLRNSEKIMGFDEDLTCDITRDFTLTYKDASTGWVVS